MREQLVRQVVFVIYLKNIHFYSGLCILPLLQIERRSIMVHRKTVIFFLIVAITISITAAFANTSPKAEAGVMDLSGWNFERDGAVTLAGEFDFYPQKFYSPEEISARGVTPPLHVPVPKSWKSYTVNGGTMAAEGYGTFHLKIILPEVRDTLALKFMTIGTAFQLYLNGTELTSAGTTGTSRAEMSPEARPHIADFTPHSRQIDLVFHVSNYHYRNGGLMDPITIGLEKNIRKNWVRSALITIILLGGILLMFIYHSMIFLLRRDDRAPLYFALICLLIFQRALVQGERYILHIFPDFPFEMIFNLEFGSWYLALAAFLFFVHSLFPNEFHRPVLYTLTSISTAAAAITFITPVRIDSHLVDAMVLVTLLVGLYGLYVVIRALIHRRENAGIFMTGITIIFLSMLNDALHSIHVIHTAYTMSFALYLFIIVQSYMLSRRFSLTFLTAQNLKERVEEDNSRMAQLLLTIDNSIEKLGVFSETITDTAGLLQDDMTSQGSSLEETAAALEEVTASTESIVENAETQESIVHRNNSILQDYIGSLSRITEAAHNASGLSKQSLDEMEKSRQRLNDIIEGMEVLKKSSADINEFTQVINDIAEQTNLLSLNASIEAARAGESGRGFAVVAEEIGKLADVSIAQAKSIQQHIEKTQADIEEETRIVTDSSTSIMGIGKVVNEVNEAISTILDLCIDQEKLTREIQENTGQISQGSSDITFATQQQKGTIHEISQTIDDLNNIMFGVINSSQTLHESIVELKKQILELKKTSSQGKSEAADIPG